MKELPQRLRVYVAASHSLVQTLFPWQQPWFQLALGSLFHWHYPHTCMRQAANKRRMAEIACLSRPIYPSTCALPWFINNMLLKMGLHQYSPYHTKCAISAFTHNSLLGCDTLLILMDTISVAILNQGLFSNSRCLHIFFFNAFWDYFCLCYCVAVSVHLRMSLDYGYMMCSSFCSTIWTQKHRGTDWVRLRHPGDGCRAFLCMTFSNGLI